MVRKESPYLTLNASKEEAIQGLYDGKSLYPNDVFVGSILVFSFSYVAFVVGQS